MTTYPQTTDPLGQPSRPSGAAGTHSEDHGRVIDLNVNVKHHGAKGDGAIYFCNTTNGSAVITTPLFPVFVSTDVGKVIAIVGAGPAGAFLETTIVGFTSTSQVTIGATASASLTNTGMVWGTDDSAAVTAAVTEALTNGPRDVFFPNKGGRAYLLKNVSATSWQHIRFRGSTYGTQLQCLGDNPMFIVEKSSHHGLFFEHLTFQGNIVGTPGTSQVAFETNMAAPVGASNSFSPHFSHCEFNDLHYSIKCDQDVTELTGMWFDNVEFSNAPMLLDADNAMNVMGFTNKCRWSGINHNVPAVDIAPSGLTFPTNVLFDGCITESNGAQAIRARKTSPLRLNHHYQENNNTQHNAGPFPIFDLSGTNIHVMGGNFNASGAWDALQFGNAAFPADVNMGFFEHAFIADVTASGSIDYTQFPNLVTKWSTGNSMQFFTGRGPTGGSSLYDFCVDVKRLAIDGGPLIQSGTGSPEGAVFGYVGSLYLRTDSANALWVKQTGNNTNTGWVAK